MFQLRSRIVTVVLPLLAMAVGALGGCGSAIVREWTSLYTVADGQLNRLEAKSDGTATATLYATTAATPGAWTQLSFKGSWREEDYVFVFDLACVSADCDGDDFQMRCVVIDEENGKTWKLDCTGNKKWQNYPFFWQEVL
jgi:hypothetical protein